MASKFGLAGGIPERRVRPIWDAVDSRQFKTALKLCTGLLAKYPSSPYALALKALILERMGKPDEALSVCLNAKEQLYSNDIVHVDDLTLSTLQIVFQRLDRLDMATSCYEHACGKYPNNLELMMGLFNCYVREYSFVKQQQTAIKMYKVVGEERFLLWAVCSIQLQVFCSDGGEKLLPLAEALLKKHIASHSLHEPEGLLIYISILEQQAKYGAALEVLSGDLGSLIVIEVDKLRMQGRLLARACDYAVAADTFQKVLELCPDDWESFLHYLGCLLEEDFSWSGGDTSDQICSSKGEECKCSHLTEELFDKCISSSLSFVHKLQMEPRNDSVRCPYLATIEIEKRRRLYGKPDDGKLMDALLKYFCRFGYLSCFTSDVEPFVHVLTHEEKEELLRKFIKASESSSLTPIQTLGQATTLFKIQELFGSTFRLSVSDLKDVSRRMVEMYCKNLTFSKDLEPQESVHGEELLLLACNLLVQLFWRTRQLGYLLEGIMVLEFGLAIRRHVWQYKILLLHLYSHLGALPSAYEWYKTLEVKNILLETVSHHILPQMLKSPLWLDLAELIKEYLKFMDDFMRDAADLTFLAYRHRNYSKVIEFVQFKERLQHSSQYLMAKVETSILELKQKADNLEETESVLENLKYGTQMLQVSNEEECKSLTFNEDLPPRPWWSPTSDVNYLLVPFEADLVYPGEALWKHQAGDKEVIVHKVIQRRSLLPRLIYLSILAASSSFKECVNANGSTFDSKNCSELKCLLENYSRNLGYPFDEAIEVIAGLSEGHKSLKDFNSDMLCWIEFAVFVNAWNLSSHHSGLHIGDECGGQSSWNIVNSLILKYVTEQLMAAQPMLTCPGSNLPILVQLVTESCFWHILVIQSCVRSMLPFGKKKKKSGAVDQSNTPLSQAIQSSIQSLSSLIKNVKEWLEDQINKPEEESLGALLHHLQKREFEVGPGYVFQIVEEAASASDLELGERISRALQSWSSADVMRKISKGQCTVLSEFYRICDAKWRLLESLKLSI